MRIIHPHLFLLFSLLLLPSQLGFPSCTYFYLLPLCHAISIPRSASVPLFLSGLFSARGCWEGDFSPFNLPICRVALDVDQSSQSHPSFPGYRPLTGRSDCRLQSRCKWPREVETQAGAFSHDTTGAGSEPALDRDQEDELDAANKTRRRHRLVSKVLGFYSRSRHCE